MSELNESIEALEAFSAQLIEAETDVKAEDSDGKLSFEFDTAKEAEMMAEKIGCTGSHEGAEGTYIPCATEEQFQAILDAEKGLEAEDVEVKEVDRDDAAGTREMIEGIIDLANSDEEPAKAAAAQMEFDSESEAVLAAEVLKCSGVHSHSEGKFMPCETHEALVEAVGGFKAPAEPMDMNPEKSEDEKEIEIKSEDAEIAEATDAETAEFVEAEEEIVEEKTADDLLGMMEVEEDTEVEVKSEDLAEMMDPSDEEEISELAAIEALAVKSAGEGAEVLNSGFSPADNTYVIDVKTADDIIREYFYSGDGVEKGYLVVEAAGSSEDFISEEKAAEIAVEYKSGEVVSIEPGLILGNDAFVVEIDEVEGKSYDVFVSFKGEILGHDEYELVTEVIHDEEELSEIKALEAELEIKRMYGRKKREELAESGEAMQDGSFPIVDEADLKNAIQAHGRAKDIDAAKKHIVKRAKALGLEALIPAEWGVAPKEEAEEEKGLESTEEIDEKIAVAEVEGVVDTTLADAEVEVVPTATEATPEEAEAVEALQSDDDLLAEFADLMRDI